MRSHRTSSIDTTLSGRAGSGARLASRFFTYSIAAVLGVLLVTINADAAAAYSRPSISISRSGGNNPIVLENSGAITDTIKCNSTLTAPYSLFFKTEDNTALAGSDYTATSGTLVFPPGDTEQVVRFPILYSAEAEPVKTFRITYWDEHGLIRSTEIKILDISIAPAGPATKVLSLINSRYRVPLHLPPVDWNAQLAKAAQNHANYLKLNKYLGHDELPGKPGYTGADPSGRCTAAGFGTGCGEVAHGIPDLLGATSSWLETPYHGLPFLESTLVGCGWSDGGSVCDLYGDLHGSGRIDRSNWSAAANAVDSPIRVWPVDGATDVPTTWNGGETPDPLAEYTGDKGDVGPVLFAYEGYGAERAETTITVEATLTDVHGKTVPLFEPDPPFGNDPTTPRRSGASSVPIVGWTAFFAAKELRPSSSYTLTIASALDGRVRVVHFKTAGDGSSSEPAPKPKARITKLSLSARTMTRQNAGQTMITFQLSAYAGSNLYWRLEQQTRKGWTRTIPSDKSKRVRMPSKARTKGSHTIRLASLIGTRKLARRHSYRLVMIGNNTRRVTFSVR